MHANVSRHICLAHQTRRTVCQCGQNIQNVSVVDYRLILSRYSIICITTCITIPYPTLHYPAMSYLPYLPGLALPYLKWSDYRLNGAIYVEVDGLLYRP